MCSWSHASQEHAGVEMYVVVAYLPSAFVFFGCCQPTAFVYMMPEIDLNYDDLL